MTCLDRHRIELPGHWTPEQALAVFELIELLRDQLWVAYAPAIQHALRHDLRSGDDAASTPALRDDPPF